MDPFRWAEYERGNRHLLRRAPLVCAARFCSEEHASAGEFFYISKLVSSVIKAEGVAGYGFGRSETICRRRPPGRHGYYCNFCNLESNSSGVTQKRPMRVTSKPANEDEAR